MKLAVLFADWQVIDARMTHRHQPVLIKLPVLIAERAVPVSRVVMPFIREANGDPIALKRPQFLDQSVVELPRPFALQKTHDLRSAEDELWPVAPPALGAVGEGHLFRVTGVPSIPRADGSAWTCIRLSPSLRPFFGRPHAGGAVPRRPPFVTRRP